MMRVFLFLIFFPAMAGFGQKAVPASSNFASDEYVKQIDRLRLNGQLDSVKLRDMHVCGGGVTGFFQKDHLVYIDACYNAELGFISQRHYLKNGEYRHTFYRQVSAEWGKYAERYPNEEIDPEKMTYTDTTTVVNWNESAKVDLIAGGKRRSIASDENMLERLMDCGNMMQATLKSEWGSQRE